MSTKLARRFRVDVSPDGTTWTQLKAINDFSPQDTPNLQDATTFDNDGYTSSEATTRSWQAVVKCLRNTDNAGALDPGQELVRQRDGEFDDDLRIHVRWYDKTDGSEAKSGLAIVEWNESKTGVADLNEVQITFTGDGKLTKLADVAITDNPKPSLVSALPSGAGTGDQVTIKGSYFTGTTAVKFGSTAATEYTVVSDSIIVAVLPSGSAGAANVTVTNATGVSDALSYTRAA